MLMVLQLAFVKLSLVWKSCADGTENFYALACVLAVEWALLEYSSTSDAHEQLSAVLYA
jgi:hypothetical protein